MADPTPDVTKNVLSEAAKGAKGFGTGALKYVVEHPLKSTGALAGITAVAALLWPKKEQEVTNDQGQQETVRKSSGFKKTVVTLGAIATVAALVLGKTEKGAGWVNKILEGRAAKAATGAAGPSVGA
jgi:hypothetical protein